LNPATAMLGTDDLQDRTERAEVSWVIVNADDATKFQGVTGDFTIIQVQDGEPGQTSHPTLYYSDSHNAAVEYTPTQETRADETRLLYVSSVPTSLTKLFEHTSTSYPGGRHSTMFWIGIEPGDVHLNVAAPGWAMHAWSIFFAPWIAGSTIFIYNYSRFDVAA